MKRTLRLSALALATLSSVATSSIDLGAWGSTESLELGPGELSIVTSGVEGENQVDGVWIDVEVSADVEGRLTDRVEGLEVVMTSDRLDEPLRSELVPLNSEGRLVGSAYVDALALYEACDTFPACEDRLLIDLELVDEVGRPVDAVRATGDMFFLVNIRSAGSSEGDSGVGRVEDIQLDWQPL